MSSGAWWRSGLVAGLGAVMVTGSSVAQMGSVPPGPLWQEGLPATVEPEIARLNDALTRLAERLRPALVQLRIQRATGEAEGEEGQRRSMGSGFLVHPDGYLVTNAHVVEGTTTVQVRLASGRRLRGTVIGRDGRVDLALVKVESGEKLPVLPLGDSNQLRVGEFVLALGHPFGLEQTVSFGIVSRKGAPLLAAAPGFDFVQTDAAVNPGNSGGPLVNMAGQVVGVNTMAARNGSIGFAIPANLVKGLLPQLLEKGKVEWGWLGVRIEEITEDNTGQYGLTEPRGVGIQGVIPGQPAAQAGLRAKDVVLGIDGSPIAVPRDLQRVIAGTPVGKTVRMLLMRDGREQEFPVTVGRYPEDEGPKSEPPAPRPGPPR
ncbi:MAG: S1C family serine protease [Candidatus Rokuibacteriota bacterium]